MLSLAELSAAVRKYQAEYDEIYRQKPYNPQNVKRAAYMARYVENAYYWALQHPNDFTSIAYNEYVERQAKLKREIERLGGETLPEFIPEAPSPDSIAAYQAHKQGLVSVNEKWAEQNLDKVIKMGKNYYRRPK